MYLLSRGAESSGSFIEGLLANHFHIRVALPCSRCVRTLFGNIKKVGLVLTQAVVMLI